MDIMLFVQSFALLCLASILIMKFCNVFEPAAGYLGRNLNGGARGSLIDAIGSSLPELMVTLMFIATGQPELILAGVAVAAGSSIINSCGIPALSIMFAKDKNGNNINEFELNRRTTIIGGVWLIAVEVALIYALGMNEFTLGMAGMFLAAYVAYVIHQIYESKIHGGDDEEYEFEEVGSKNIWQALVNFDFNYIAFKDKEFTAFTAWSTLIFAVIGVGVSCHYLAVSVEGLANSLNIAVYFSAVIFGAAATSVPDAILSVKSAQRGDYDDAVQNAVGSNVFDVAVALPLPIFIWLLIEGGALPLEQTADLTALRYFVLASVVAVVSTLVIQSNRINKTTAWILGGIYMSWVAFIGWSL